MKNILLLCMLFVSILGKSQNDYYYNDKPEYKNSTDTSYHLGYFPHFNVKDADVYYQIIIDKKVTCSEYKNFLSKLGSITNIIIEGSTITADLISFKIPYQKYGYSYGEMAYIGNDDFYGKLIIDIKETKYRITVKNIQHVSNTNVGFYSSGISVQQNGNSKDNLIITIDTNGKIKKGSFKSFWRFYDAFDKALTENFTYKVTTQDNW